MNRLPRANCTEDRPEPAWNADSCERWFGGQNRRCRDRTTRLRISPANDGAISGAKPHRTFVKAS